MKQSIAFCTFAFFGVLGVFCQSVVATTSWTAAFARLAGAETVTVLAPVPMLHPSEYEIVPKDILTVKKADFFIYAGYEVMVAPLATSANLPPERKIQISTQNDWATIESQVRLIAERLGTVEKAKKNLASLKLIYQAARIDINASGFKAKSCLVHVFQVPVAKMLGLDIAGTFGPGPLSPKQILELKLTKAEFIIDNIHNPVAMPLSQLLSGAGYAEFLNFPGFADTTSLGDVLAYNVQQLR
jgi:hypothetical protein